MTLSAIVAHDINLGIGLNGQRPWEYEESVRKPDIKFFRDKTRESIVIMGRKTWESLGGANSYQPLPGRVNIVMSRSGEVENSDYCEVVSSLQVALDLAESLIGQECDVWKRVKREYHPDKKKMSDEVFIIGGAGVYESTLDKCDKLYVTRIDSGYECDVMLADYTSKMTKCLECDVECEKGEKLCFEEWCRK